MNENDLDQLNAMRKIDDALDTATDLARRYGFSVSERLRDAELRVSEAPEIREHEAATHNGFPADDGAALDNIARHYQEWDDDDVLCEVVAEAIMATGREIAPAAPERGRKECEAELEGERRGKHELS